jgi:hypothetical protein
MKKILLTIACLWALVAASQKPTTNMVYLTTPNNVTFQYHTTTADTWMNRGSYSSIRIPQSVWHLSNISNTGWADGKVLKFNSSGDLVPGTTTGGTGIALTDLSATSPIVYNNTTGVFSMAANAYAPYGTVSFPGFGTSGTTAAYGNHLHGTDYKPGDWFPTWTEVTGKPSTFAPSAHTIDSHSNFSIYGGSPAYGDIIRYYSTGWVNSSLTEAGIQETLNGTGFVVASGTTITYDNNTYLTAVPNNSVSYAKLSTYNSPSNNDVLSYDPVNGLVWDTPSGVSYTLPAAGISTLGGVELGFTNTNGSVALQTSTNKGFVTITKSATEYALTGTITSHDHNTTHAALAGSTSQAFSASNLTLSGTITGATTITGSSTVKGSEFTFGTTGWTIAESSGKLVFKYNGTAVFSMDQSGNFKAAAEIYRGGL